MTTLTFKIALPSRKPPPKPPRRSDRLARQLALAHHIERLIDTGRLCDYTTAAQLLGITRARMTQIMDLLGMAVEEQERVLIGSPTGEA